MIEKNLKLPDALVERFFIFFFEDSEHRCWHHLTVERAGILTAVAVTSFDQGLSIGGIHDEFSPLYVYVLWTKLQRQMDSNVLNILTVVQHK